MNLFYKLTKNPNLKKNCLSKGGGEGGGGWGWRRLQEWGWGVSEFLLRQIPNLKKRVGGGGRGDCRSEIFFFDKDLVGLLFWV